MKLKFLPEGRYGWCWHCKHNIRSVIVRSDYGHVYEDHVCPECGERVSEPKYEEENES